MGPRKMTAPSKISDLSVVYLGLLNVVVITPYWPDCPF